MNKKFQMILVLSIILIIVIIAVGISAQIPINRLIQYQKPENNYSSCCNVKERDSESNNIEGYQSSCCEEDENNSNYETLEEYYPSSCSYEKPNYYNENYRSRCH